MVILFVQRPVIIKLTIGFADKSIYCDKLNKEQAEILQLEEGDPSLIIDEVVFLGNGYIFDLSQVVYNYKNTKLLCQATFKQTNVQVKNLNLYASYKHKGFFVCKYKIYEEFVVSIKNREVY